MTRASCALDFKFQTRNVVAVNTGDETEYSVLTDEAYLSRTENRACCTAYHCEKFSVFCSFVCLCLTVYWRFGTDDGREFGSLAIKISRETLLYSRDAGVAAGMRLLQSTWNKGCKSKFALHVQTPGWNEDDLIKSDDVGLVMHANIAAGYFSIWWTALFVFIFSISFQTWRVCNYNRGGSRDVSTRNFLYRPSSGPDFSRWLEYFFTSPLQILVVSTAFGFATIDSLIGQCGMQAALVLLGYDIEKQIKKIYKRRMAFSKTYIPARAHHALHAWGIQDLRLFVYLAFAWLLHYFIWGLPEVEGHGIGGKFTLLRKQLRDCEVGESIPVAVQLIFYFQFILFTVFGLVATAQTVSAFGSKTLTQEEIANRWLRVSLYYSVLSVVAKTLLEVALAVFVFTYRPWVSHPAWETIPRNWTEANCTIGVRDTTCTPYNSTCWALLPPRVLSL